MEFVIDDITSPSYDFDRKFSQRERLVGTLFSRLVVIRRFTCFMLIPFLLANQALAMVCPHQHEGTMHDDLKQRPHIHIGFHGHHDHVRCDNEDHHRQEDYHQHEDHQHHDDGLGLETIAVMHPGDVPCGHDCDAIYFSTQVPYYLPTVQHDLAPVNLALIDFVVVNWTLPAVDARPSRPVALRGPYSQGRYALFLQILSLRI